MQERASALGDLKTLGRRIARHPVYLEQSRKDSRLKSVFGFVKDYDKQLRPVQATDSPAMLEADIRHLYQGLCLLATIWVQLEDKRARPQP